MQRRATVVDGIPELDPASADRAPSGLGLQERTALLGGSAVLTSAGCANGPVLLAEHAPVPHGGGAALALTPLAAAQTVVGLVDRDPVPMLRRLASARGERRKAIGLGDHAVSAAVLS
jgi:hypothetical protein